MAVLILVRDLRRWFRSVLQSTTHSRSRLELTGLGLGRRRSHRFPGILDHYSRNALPAGTPRLPLRLGPHRVVALFLRVPSNSFEILATDAQKQSAGLVICMSEFTRLFAS
jgi:hypothetical protein